MTRRATGVRIAWMVACVAMVALPCVAVPKAAKPAPSARSTQSAVDRAVRAVYPALVRIDVVMVQGSGGRMRKGHGSGSGTIISPKGYVLTNHHVAGRATRLLCRLSDREELEAELVATDALTDLAVLKLDLSTRRSKKPLPVAKFGDSSKVVVGQRVLAMGSPAGLSQSVTMGIVSNAEMILPGGGSMVLDGEPVGTLVRWIGHDAVIYPGNSGGPLVNLDGEIIGVNEVGIASLGGAIPSNLARDVAKQLIENKCVRRSWTGLEVQPLLKSMPKARGVLLAGVTKDSPAAKAGLQAGDIITHFDGHAVHARVYEELPLFFRVLLSTPVGTKAEVRYRRNGKARKTYLTTIIREPARARERELKDWGMTARDLTRLGALERRRAKKGVLVDSVRPGGPCSEAKPPVRPGDVILSVDGHDTPTLADLIRVTARLTAGQEDRRSVLVGYEREQRELLTVVRIGPDKPEDKPAQASKAWLGVLTQVLTRDLAKALDLAGKKGVRVTRVLPGTTAEKAGLQVGDILLKLDGEVIPAREVEDNEVFAHMVRQYRIGTEVELAMVRKGKPQKLTVALEARPKPATELKQYKDRDFEFSARELSFDDRLERELKKDARGVLIDSVQPAGWASLAGLESGDILLRVAGKPVANVAELEKQMQAIRRQRAKRIVLFVRRGIHTAFIELEPDWSAAAGSAPAPTTRPAPKPKTKINPS